MVLEKTLKSPLDSKEIKPVNPKGNYLEYSLEGLMLKLKLQYFGHLMGRADWLEKTLILGKIEDRRRRGQQRIRRLDDLTDSIGMSLSKLWEIVKDREAWVLQSMGSQRVRHNLATENNKWTFISKMGKLENAENSVLLSVGEDFPGGPVVRNPPSNIGSAGLTSLV